MAQRDGIDYFRKVAEGWFWQGLGFGALHITIGVSAIAFAAAVAQDKPLFFWWEAKPDAEKLLSVIAAGLVTFFSANDTSIRFMKAYRRLRPVIEKFDHDEKLTFDDVDATYQEGISIIEQTPIKAPQG